MRDNKKKRIRIKEYILLAWLAVIFLILTSCAPSLPPYPSSQDRLRIAVIGMSHGIADQKVANMLVTALTKKSYFTVVEQEMVSRIIEEQKFQLSGIVAPDTAVKLGELLDVQAVIKGEVVETKTINKPLVAGSLLIYSATVTAYAIDAKTGKTIAAVSESGKSTAGVAHADLTSGGKTKKDILGIKRSEEDMYNSAVRSAVEDAAVAIIKAVYGHNKRFEVIDVDAKPNYKIELLTKNISDTNYFSARAKIYFAPFAVVWAAVHEYVGGTTDTSDEKVGVITAKSASANFRSEIFVLVERNSEESTKVTAKYFCYNYTKYQSGYYRWEKNGPDFCTNILLRGLKKRIKKRWREEYGE
jgi:hypothetical protein